MGLEISHDAWNGAYSSFNSWRDKISEISGFPYLYSMAGFGGDISWDDYNLHPITPLLNHSDCDGELTPNECKAIADFLTTVIEKLGDDLTPWGYKNRTQQFIDGCMDAYSKNESLIFH